MTRLLMVATVPITMHNFLTPIARYFRAKGWRVDAMAQGISTNSDSVAAFDHVWDITWSRQPFDPSNLLRAPRRIREVVEREGFDIVHVHTPIAAFVTRFALRERQTPNRPTVIYTAHGFHFYRGGPLLRNCAFRALERIAASWTDQLVVINEEDRQSARLLGLPPERITYMPGIGVSPDRYNPEVVTDADIRRVRRELGLAAEAPLFLAAGELIPRKRQTDLVAALARLTDPAAHLAVAGDGPEEGTLRAQARRLGVADRVHFLGYRDDIPTLNRAAVASLLVSQQEGLPRCLLESLCLNVPVIGSDIRGIRDLLAGGVGLLTPVGDVDAIAAAMRWVLNHPREVRVMTARGREWVVANATEAAILAAHECLYQRALSMKGAN